jgi:hypothetical protein
MKLTLDMIMEAVEADEYLGFCIACCTQVDGVEPDARAYHCSQCGKNKVYGAEELLTMLTA